MSTWVLLWVACALGAAIIGGRKGNPIMGFLAGALLGPIGVVIALLSGDKHRRPCDHCAEPIMRQAKLCPHCQKPTNW